MIVASILSTELDLDDDTSIIFETRKNKSLFYRNQEDSLDVKRHDLIPHSFAFVMEIIISSLARFLRLLT